MRKRREFPGKLLAEAIVRCNGRCEKCTRKLLAGDYHYDHIIPDALGGEPVITNVQVLCKSCHSVKTRTKDIPDIAKAKRRQRKNFGIRKRSSFACSRDSQWKKKIDGTVERRN